MQQMENKAQNSTPTPFYPNNAFDLHQIPPPLTFAYTFLWQLEFPITSPPCMYVALLHMADVFSPPPSPQGKNHVKKYNAF